jgi:hypothetical protein
MRQDIYENLKSLARSQNLISYSELNEELNLGFDFESPHDRDLIGELLGDISRFEVSQNRPMLSALVVHKEGQSYKDPGEGFYKLAHALGRYHGKHDYLFWAAEVKEVYNYWAVH